MGEGIEESSTALHSSSSVPGAQRTPLEELMTIIFLPSRFHPGPHSSACIWHFLSEQSLSPQRLCAYGWEDGGLGETTSGEVEA